MTKESFRHLCGVTWGIYCHGIMRIVLLWTLALLFILSSQLLPREVHAVTYFLCMLCLSYPGSPITQTR